MKRKMEGSKQIGLLNRELPLYQYNNKTQDFNYISL